MTGRIKKANKQQALDALAFNVLTSFRHHGAIQWTDWFETTKTRRGKLGPGTFSEAVKRLMIAGRVQVDNDGCYQGVFDAVAEDGGSLGAGNSADVETSRISEEFREVLREVGNGNADIADIALQRLVNAD